MPEPSDLLAALDALAVASGATDLDPVPVLAAYAEPHRRYHGIAHLEQVLANVGALAERAAEAAGGDVDALPVGWAAVYHDAVYRTDAAGSEEASAAWCERDLAAAGVDPDVVAEAARLIRLTAHHRYEDGDVAAAWLSDADLLVLAGSPAAYDRYVAAVRAEFAAVPDEDWRAGRGEVLRGLLATPRLFGIAGDEAEEAARANLARELAALGGGGAG